MAQVSISSMQLEVIHESYYLSASMAQTPSVSRLAIRAVPRPHATASTFTTLWAAVSMPHLTRLTASSSPVPATRKIPLVNTSTPQAKRPLGDRETGTLRTLLVFLRARRARPSPVRIFSIRRRMYLCPHPIPRRVPLSRRVGAAASRLLALAPPALRRPCLLPHLSRNRARALALILLHPTRVAPLLGHRIHLAHLLRLRINLLPVGQSQVLSSRWVLFLFLLCTSSSKDFYET